MLTKQPIPINFSQGLDTKSDSKQVQLGKFLVLNNSVFTKGGLLSKRNGFGQLASLPNTESSYVTTFNGNLTAIDDQIQAYNAPSKSWVSKGNIIPLDISTLPLIRNNLNQTQTDSAISDNGLVCTVYTELNNTTSHYKFAVADATTGQNIIAPQNIPVASGTVTGAGRVFFMNGWFVIVFTNTISATAHLQYIAINSINTSLRINNTDIASGYTPNSNLSFDGVVVNNDLYIAYNTTVGGQNVSVTKLTGTFSLLTPVVFAGEIGLSMSVCADISNPSSPVIWIGAYDQDPTSGTLDVFAVDTNLNVLAASRTAGNTNNYVNIASAATGGQVLFFGEVADSYDYDAAIPTHRIEVNPFTLSTQGSVTSPILSVGLASKGFVIDDEIYLLTAFQSPYQPSYFLVNMTQTMVFDPTAVGTHPVIAGKLAYSNGGGYLTKGLPSLTIRDNVASVSYLFKDLIQAVNKNTNVPAGSQVAGIYSQTGINLGNFDFSHSNIDTSEIGGDLLLSGGFLGMYDGYLPVEQNFFLWPDSIEVTPATTGGALLAQQYFYQVTYEWSDNQGNIYRSAPSIPVSTAVTAGTGITFTSIFSSGVSTITVSSATGLHVGQIITDTTTAGHITTGTYITAISGTSVTLSQPTAGASASTPGDTLKTVQTGSVTVNVPTLRLTAKTKNPVKIVIYRWSTAQQIYYQVTSLTAPLLNDTGANNVQFIDTLSDQAILGNNILYTTGGVVEDVNAPGTNLMTLFDTRFWMVDAEDRNLLWFSKQVIENTPVEMSDLFTVYVPPTTAAQGSTGPITALSTMDDKLIIFKENAIYYINGSGPDNTGANNQYSQAIFITSTVGCANQQSIVFMPQGLMFQSNKGIWLLGRDLSTKYIGDAVEEFNNSQVQSAVNVPKENQVRFTLDTGETLMFDYYYNQWGTFTGVPAISSCIFQDLHTIIDGFGRVFQETPGLYLDGSSPVLMNFTTSWIQLAGLQGYQRAYFFYVLGQYMSPHFLQFNIAYDYEPSSRQSTLVRPDNFSSAVPSPFGTPSAPFGSPSAIEQWRIFLTKQKCESFQITLNEVFDPSKGVSAGAGLTISGLNLIIGVKKGYRPISSGNSAGGSSR